MMIAIHVASLIQACLFQFAGPSVATAIASNSTEGYGWVMTIVSGLMFLSILPNLHSLFKHLNINKPLDSL